MRLWRRKNFLAEIYLTMFTRLDDSRGSETVRVGIDGDRDSYERGPAVSNGPTTLGSGRASRQDFDGDGDGELGAALGTVGRVDFAVVFGDDRVNDVQPQTARGTGGEVRVENDRHQF